MIQTCKNPAQKHCLYGVKKCYSAFDIYSKTNMSSVLSKYFKIKPFDYCFSSLQSGMFEKRIVRASFKKIFEYYSKGFCTFGPSHFLITSGKEPNFLRYCSRRNRVCRGVKLERRSEKLVSASPVLKENACVLHPVLRRGETQKLRPRTIKKGDIFFSHNHFWRRSVKQPPYGCKQTHQVLQGEHGMCFAHPDHSLRSLDCNPDEQSTISTQQKRKCYQEIMLRENGNMPPRNTKGQKKQQVSLSALRIEKSKTFWGSKNFQEIETKAKYPWVEFKPKNNTRDQASGVFFNNGLPTDEVLPTYSRLTTMRGTFDNSKMMCPDWIIETLIEQVKDKRNPRAVISQFLSNAHVFMRNLGCRSPVLGVQICASGRLSNRKKAMAQKIIRSIGTIPQSALRHKVSYSQGFVHTRIGLIGIKIWVCYK